MVRFASLLLLLAGLSRSALAEPCNQDTPATLCGSYPCLVTGVHNFDDHCTLRFIDNQANQSYGDVTVVAGASLTVPDGKLLAIVAKNFELRGSMRTGAAIDEDLSVAAQGLISIDASSSFTTAGGAEIDAPASRICVNAASVDLGGANISADLVIDSYEERYPGDISICAGARIPCFLGISSTTECMGGGALAVRRPQDISATEGVINLTGAHVDTQAPVSGSAVVLNVSSGGVDGEAGYITVEATTGSVSNGAQLRAEGTSGADAGTIDVIASGTVMVSGTIIVGSGTNSSAGSVLVKGGQGVTISPSATVAADGGDGGLVELHAPSPADITIDGAVSARSTVSEGSDGDIDVGGFSGGAPDTSNQPCDVTIGGGLHVSGPGGFGFINVGYRGTLAFGPGGEMLAGPQGTNDIYCRSSGTSCVSPPQFGSAIVSPPADVIPTALAPCSVCGDGITSLPEECDDGDSINGDECDSNCTLPRCGNGQRGGAEQCDDGDLFEGDECDTNCTLPSCGNGIQSPATGEECDYGDTVNGDGCDSNCQLEAIFRVDDASVADTRAYEPDVGADGDGSFFVAWTDNQMCPSNTADRRGLRLRQYAGNATPHAPMPIVCGTSAKHSPAVEANAFGPGYFVAYSGSAPSTQPGVEGVWLTFWSLFPGAWLVSPGIPVGRPHIAQGSNQISDMIGVSFAKKWATVQAPAEVAIAYYGGQPLGPTVGPSTLSTTGPVFPNEDAFAVNILGWVSSNGVRASKLTQFGLVPDVRVDVNGVPEGRVAIGIPAPSLTSEGAIVVWRDTRGGATKIMARMVDSWSGAGAPTFGTGELTLSEGTGNHYNSAVAMAPDGSFAAIWITAGCGSHQLVFRSFDSTGNALGPTQVVDSVVPGSRPNLAWLENDSYVLVWERVAGPGSQIWGTIRMAQ